MKRWSSRLPKEAVAAAVPIVLGIALGNVLLVCIGLVPLFYLFLSSGLPTPRDIRFESTCGTSRSWVGEEVSMSRKITAEGGSGLLIIGERVPDHFALKSGSNVKVFWKGKDRLQSEYSYSIVGRRRGAYGLGATTAECVPYSGIALAAKEEDVSSKDLVVRQKPLSIRGIKEMRAVTRTAMPVNATSRHGTRSTDFRELRRYVRGDRFRDINWKATVRLAADEDVPPLVNEFEKEGRKTVWVFLDSRSTMAVGTSVDNAFENGVKAASAVARFFLDRDCEVGLSIVGSRRALPASDGKRQAMAIERTLQEADVDGTEGGFYHAVSRLENHISGTSPLAVLVTSIRPGDDDDIREGFQRLRVVGGKDSAMTVVDVDPFGLAAEDEDEDLARGFVALEARPTIASAVAAGASVFRWDPSRQSFASVARRMLSRPGT